jgi:hypothetical protein
MLDRRAAAAADRFLAARWQSGAPLTQPRAVICQQYIYLFLFLQLYSDLNSLLEYCP